MKKTVLTFGIISGLIMSTLLLVTIPIQRKIGFDYGMLIGYAGMVAAFLLIFFGIRAYRDNTASGSVTFGQAFRVGAGIALISSLMYVATWEIIYFGFRSDFMEQYQAYQLEKAREKGATPAELEAQIAKGKVDAARYRNPFFNSAVTLLEALPLGVIMSLIAAAALSRSRRLDAGLSEVST
jgi:hypothetical protein